MPESTSSTVRRSLDPPPMISLLVDAGGVALRELVHQDDADEVQALLRDVVDGSGRGELVARMATDRRPGPATYFHLVLSRGERGAVDHDAAAAVVVQGWNVTSLVRRIHDLERHAYQDALTGLANRSVFTDRLRHELVRSARTGSEVAVMYADIDDFKVVNDTHGHDTGDQVLVHVSRRLTECLRPADTLARLGGDEFAVICPDISGLSQALAIAERLREGASDDLVSRGVRLSVNLSVGVAMAREDDRGDRGEHGDPVAGLLRRADEAMYTFKRERQALTAVAPRAGTRRGRARPVRPR